MNQKLANTDYDAYGYTYIKTTRIEEHLRGQFRPRLMANRMLSLSKQMQERCSKTITVNSSRKKNIAEEKIKLVQAAAKLIKEDIKDIRASHEVYPFCNDLKSEEAGIKYLEDTVRRIVRWDKNWN